MLKLFTIAIYNTHVHNDRYMGRPNGGRSIYNLAANCCGGVQFDTLLAYVIKSISTTISDRA